MGYSDEILDHFEHPRHVGSFAGNDVSAGTGVVGSIEQGGVIKLQIKVDEHGVIQDTRFKAYGCVSTIAAGSLVAEWLRGKTLERAAEIDNRRIAETLAIAPLKIHCAVLAEDAVNAAIADLIGRDPSPAR
jgi:nitrogen fixation NifU-like protein